MKPTIPTMVDVKVPRIENIRLITKFFPLYVLYPPITWPESIIENEAEIRIKTKHRIKPIMTNIKINIQHNSPIGSSAPESPNIMLIATTASTTAPTTDPIKTKIPRTALGKPVAISIIPDALRVPDLESFPPIDFQLKLLVLIGIG